MANNISKMSDLMAVTGENAQVLGKFVYFSLSNILVYREDLQQICEAMGLENISAPRPSDANAFRCATGDIKGRVVDQMQIYRVFCRDNERQGEIISRELVKETLDATTNQYAKLANLSLNTGLGLFSYDNLAFDPVINPYPYCEEAQRLYERYQQCVGRKQIETLTNNFLDRMQALKISVHGRLYFVPRSHMHEVSLFEDFIEALNTHNQHTSPLVVNSMYVMDDEKQRREMAAEFYNNVRKEIEEYQERAQHLISSGSQSPSIMNRWILKIDALEAKKREYEEILNRQLDDLNSEFTILRTFSQELASRVRSIELQKAA